MKLVIEQDFERVDRLARRLYGNERGGALERLLAANPGLAALAAGNAGSLPRGTVVVVPAPAPTAPDPAYVRPWQ